MRRWRFCASVFFLNTYLFGADSESLPALEACMRGKDACATISVRELALGRRVLRGFSYAGYARQRDNCAKGSGIGDLQSRAVACA